MFMYLLTMQARFFLYSLHRAFIPFKSGDNRLHGTTMRQQSNDQDHFGV